MRTTTLRKLRRTLAATIDSVNADREPVLVTGEAGQPTAVLMSAEDFSSLEETAYLLRSPHNAVRLLGSIEALGSGFGIGREVLE